MVNGTLKRKKTLNQQTAIGKGGAGIDDKNLYASSWLIIDHFSAYLLTTC